MPRRTDEQTNAAARGLFWCILAGIYEVCSSSIYKNLFFFLPLAKAGCSVGLA